MGPRDQMEKRVCSPPPHFFSLAPSPSRLQTVINEAKLHATHENQTHMKRSQNQRHAV